MVKFYILTQSKLSVDFKKQLLIFAKYFSRVKDELHIPGAVLSIDLRPNLVQHQHQSLSLSPATPAEPFIFTFH